MSGSSSTAYDLERVLVGTRAAIRRFVRRLDHVADRYEASINSQRGRNSMDWAVSALLCLWTVIQVGVLTHYLQVYPLF